MIDAQGFRPNVGIVLLNEYGRVFWGRRVGVSGWQFPQGGINRDETPEMAMYRELREEVGLEPQHVEVIGCTRRWLRYRLPKRYVRHNQRPVCIGQKQIWYVLELAADEGKLKLDHSEEPEFDRWRWIEYWESLQLVVPFKRQVYRQALRELAPLILNGSSISIPETPTS
jgi:putative (di)nucleoside polyphosphate hydrolase